MPVLNPAVQLCAQLLTPAGLLVTVPAPVPLTCTASVGSKVKLAVTDVLLFSVKVQEAVVVLLQAPLQPANAEPGFAVAASVTWDPAVKPALQVVPQLIPAGLLAMVPEPVPASETVNVGAAEKVAVTELLLLRVRVQVAVPLQAPLHPMKDEFAAGVAVSVA